MGCVASAIAEREKNKAKVQPVSSANTLRGDLLSRNEARQRRIKIVAEHHAKANKIAKTIAYNTMAEKEMMSTSTERSYRSGRAFLISATASSFGDTNASEQGSSSTVSDGPNSLRPELPAMIPRMKTDSVKTISTQLPYSVPEEESLHQLQESCKVKGQEVRLQDDEVKSQRTSQEGTADDIDKSCDERTQECDDDMNDVGSNSETRINVNINEQEVKSQEAGLESEVSHTNTNEKSQTKKPARVKFKNETVDSEDTKKEDISANKRTKPTDNGTAQLPRFSQQLDLSNMNMKKSLVPEK